LRMKFWTDFRPATGALAALVCFLAVGAAAETTNTLSDAEIQGRQLAQKIISAIPETNVWLNGLMKIKDGKGTNYNYFFQFGTGRQIQLDTRIQNTSFVWLSTYVFGDTTNVFGAVQSDSKISDEIATMIIIKHFDSANFPVEYDMTRHWHLGPASDGIGQISDKDLSSSVYKQSDFWVADLGLEFFHWPAQKVLPNPTSVKRGRAYTLLESTNPNPATNGYSRVLSWIDKETGGILEAEAYDFNGRLLKDFAPKSFKKVNGQWELQEMEIRNVQTGSRTRLEFDLTK